MTVLDANFLIDYLAGDDATKEFYAALNVPDGQRQAVLYRELAVSLYREGVLSFGKARELAGLSRREFHQLPGERQIERHYTSEDLEDDLEYARG